MIVKNDNLPKFRVVLIGDSSVGKTCILAQLIDHKFSINEQATVGANYQIYIDDVNTNGRDSKVEVQIWDTAGQERFRSLGPIYYRNAQGALAVFDMTNRQSFAKLDEWIKNFKDIAGDDKLIYVIANKSDLTDSIQVPFCEAQKFADDKKYKAFETSAKTGKNIQPMFSELARDLFESNDNSICVHENEPLQEKPNCNC